MCMVREHFPRRRCRHRHRFPQHPRRRRDQSQNFVEKRAKINNAKNETRKT